MGLLSKALQMADATGRTTDRPDTGAPPAPLRDPVPAAPREADAPAPAVNLAPDPADAPGPLAALAPQEPAMTADASRIDERLEVLHQPASAVSEQFRAIRTGMLARWQNQRHMVHAFTSAQPQEGRTLTVLNLGLCFAELSQRRVLVLEADLRRPHFAAYMGLPEGPGLAEVLEQRASIAQAAATVASARLDVIAAGHALGNQALQVLSSPATVGLLGELRRRYDHVLIDTPPVLPFADAGILGALSDEIILVTRLNLTPLALVRQAVSILAGYNAPVAGLIATEHTRSGLTLSNFAQQPAAVMRQKKDAA
jgi:Mrp family chromosome partitioning ATPase